MSIIGKTTCILLRVVSIICNWSTSWVMFGRSMDVRLHSGGSCWFYSCGNLCLLVLDRSLLLGGPSTCVGIIWVAATSGCFSFGSCCLFGPCWSVFHPLRSWNSMQKYIVSSGHKFLNTGITVIRFTPGIWVSATAYFAWVTLLLVYIFIPNVVQFGKEFPQNISFWSLFVGRNTLAIVQNERNMRSSRRTRCRFYQFTV